MILSNTYHILQHNVQYLHVADLLLPQIDLLINYTSGLSMRNKGTKGRDTSCNRLHVTLTDEETLLIVVIVISALVLLITLALSH